MNKKVRKVSPIDLSRYVNADTGETLSSEGALIVRNEDTGLVVISSEEYATIDAAAWHYISLLLNDSDLGRLSKMAQMTQTTWNILFAKNNIPHSSKTLRFELGMESESMFFSMIRRLKKIGVLYVLDGLIYGEVRKIYMLNPYLARKRKTISDRAAKLFKRLEQEKE